MDTGENAMDTELLSLSDDLSETSGDSVRNLSCGGLFQDNRSLKLTKKILTLLKLQITSKMRKHSEPDKVFKGTEGARTLEHCQR